MTATTLKNLVLATIASAAVVAVPASAEAASKPRYIDFIGSQWNNLPLPNGTQEFAIGVKGAKTVSITVGGVKIKLRNRAKYQEGRQWYGVTHDRRVGREMTKRKFTVRAKMCNGSAGCTYKNITLSS